MAGGEAYGTTRTIWLSIPHLLARTRNLPESLFFVSAISVKCPLILPTPSTGASTRSSAGQTGSSNYLWESLGIQTAPSTISLSGASSSFPGSIRTSRRMGAQDTHRLSGFSFGPSQRPTASRKSLLRLSSFHYKIRFSHRKCYDTISETPVRSQGRCWAGSFRMRRRSYGSPGRSRFKINNPYP